jgi:integrase/recombinase XerC/integrase/recombinase XerD
LRIWGKGRDARDEFAVLTEPTERALADYLATRGPLQPSDPLFVGVGRHRGGQRLSRRNIRRRVTFYLEKAGLKRARISAHSLRHSFVTLAIEGGASIVQTQTAARHRSVQTTLVYFHEHTRLTDPVEDRIEI